MEVERPSEEAPRGNEGQSVNLPPLLAAQLGRGENGKPLQSSLTSAYGGQVLPNNIGGNLLSNEDYPFPDGLKMPSHIGSYDGKGDPDNFLHLFEGAIRMQKWLMPIACHMFTYTLKDSAKIWWNSQKAGSILDYKDLKAKFQSHFSQQKKFTKTHLVVNNIKQREGESTRAFITRYTDDTLQILGLHEEQRISSFVHGLRTRSLVKHLSTDLLSTYKGLMEKNYTWAKAKEVATNGASGDRRDNFKRSKKSSWDNNRGQKNKDKFSPYQGPNHGLLPSLSKSLKEILAMEKTARSFEPPPKMFEKAVNSGQLSHLVKGLKKERTKSSDIPRGESKKDKGTAPAEAPILMVSRVDHITKSPAQENTDYGRNEIIFPLVAKVNNAPVIIEAKIFRRKVGRVYMDSGSSSEIIYEHCFVKLNPTIKATTVDLKTPLVGFSRTEILNFIIVRSESLHNILLGRTAMQRMGIVVSTIHGAIKFHTKKGIGTVLSVDETEEGTKRARKILATKEERVLSCVNAKEKFIINDKYPDQMVTIGKQLPEHFKKELQILLKSNADVFTWTHTDMTGIPRTIMVEGKPFNTEHKLNKYSHVKPIKQNKKGLGPDRSMAAYAYKGYHQIQMVEEDEDKTAFYAGEGVFCYKKMLFCIKNAGATYQSLVDKVLSHQIRRNLEAYIDDIVIKSTSEKEMSKDIQETFERFNRSR
ncbi:reverse transcriptase domain-containing protein [Tanacetum coccineum]